MLCLDVDRLYKLQGEMTDTEFSKKLGISRSQLWRLKNKRSAVGATFMAKFKAAFPDESMDAYFFTSGVPLKEQ